MPAAMAPECVVGPPGVRLEEGWRLSCQAIIAYGIFPTPGDP